VVSSGGRTLRCQRTHYDLIPRRNSCDSGRRTEIRR
jgi:hypothetical protein